jgi:hypothetical protein
MGAGELLALAVIIAYAWKTLIDAVGSTWGAFVPITAVVAYLYILWLQGVAGDEARRLYQ